jgi:LysM repeat protein
VRKRIALVLALVTMLAMAAIPSVALAADGVGNVVGYPFPGSPICITAVDGSMINNCQAQDPLRPYQPVKFDGVSPKVYIVTSGPAKAFVFAYPDKDNMIDWAWAVPGWWNYSMSTPPAPTWHMWQPGGQMTNATEVNVEQSVNVTGSGSVGQTVDVKSSGPTKVHVDQSVNMQATAATGSAKCFTYWIQKGDNLTKIAVRFGDSVKALVTRNHISNASKIYAGQKLTVCDP